MTPHPNHPEKPERPRFDIEGAHAFLLLLTALIGTPAVVVMLVWKGIGAALAMALMVALVWLQLAGLIPQQWEIEAMRRKAGPVERAVVAVLAIILIVICVGSLVSPKNAGWHYVEDGKDRRGVMAGSGPVTGERLLQDMLRKE